MQEEGELESSDYEEKHEGQPENGGEVYFSSGCDYIL